MEDEKKFGLNNEEEVTEKVSVEKVEQTISTTNNEPKKSNKNNTNKDNSKKGLNEFFKGIKAEFRKIIWPSMHSLRKQSVTVIVTSLVLGAVVFCYDEFFSTLLALFVRVTTK